MIGLGVAAAPATAIGRDGREAQCNIFPNQMSTENHCFLTTGPSQASASLSVSPDVMLHAAASGPNTESQAFVGYDFNILGGMAGDIVDIAVTARLRTSLTGDGSSFAQLFYENSDTNGSITVCDSTNPLATACVDNHSYDGTFHYSGTVGDLQHLQQVATASGGTIGTGAASVDPFIAVTGISDPAASYRVQTIGGIGNAPPGSVPEPATWALLLGGFGLVGRSMRRRACAVAA
ncbi:PEPxxWA-CTERM sorting domain-containing protein [Sphingomonas bacterium]|uniref:PEPxxWA-CTERM sorting domain-containing protein n=1 Tax=Sphingomonas bacterium TaxID=1895847 RepID=UPI0020C73A6A|nr:PEPxxWA-CTERM sorting domain-containing protein [Sphingomonas bacterium]